MAVALLGLRPGREQDRRIASAVLATLLFAAALPELGRLRAPEGSS